MSVLELEGVFLKVSRNDFLDQQHVGPYVLLGCFPSLREVVLKRAASSFFVFSIEASAEALLSVTDNKLKLGAIQGPRLNMGGTHASPRIHYRAGHFRMIHKGTPRQREVPVAPTIVGVGDERELRAKGYI